MLEPRILLSGAPTEDLIAGTALTVLTLPQQQDDVGGVHRATEHKPNAAAFTQSAPEQVDNIFAGVKVEDLDAPAENHVADVQENSGSSSATSSGGESKSQATVTSNQEHAGDEVNVTSTADSNTISPQPTNDSSIKPEASGAQGETLVDQLTQGLLSSNGPPQDSGNQTVANSDNGDNIVNASSSSSTSTVSDLHLTPDSPVSSLTVEPNQKLTGSGTIAGDLINRGTISPGNSPGIQTVTGDMNFGSSGRVIIEIGGLTPGPGTPTDNGYDRVAISGKATFGGVLEVRLINSFAPQVGQQFDVITYGSGAGDFENYVGLAIGSGLYFKPTFNSNRLTLEVATRPAGAPQRPVIFIPDFGESFAADSTPAGLRDWALTRGVAPDKLSLDPLRNSDTNLIRSLVTAGYQKGVDLFVANWDWRLPLAGQDGTRDGSLSTVTAASLTDTNFQTGVDYLGYALNQAVQAWKALGNSGLPQVDVIGYGAGGLIARSYIQSAGYGGAYGSDNLPQVNNLIQVATPNQGLPGTFNMIRNDFSFDGFSRLTARMISMAGDLLRNDPTLKVQNPDGTFILPSALSNPTQFIRRYVASVVDLLPTYVFADLGTGTFVPITQANVSVENGLLLDLNGGTDANRFVTLTTGVVSAVYSGDVNTSDRVAVKTGFQQSLGAKNELLPYDKLLGDTPTTGQGWFAEVESSSAGPEGDGIVPTVSAVGLLQGDSTKISSGKLRIIALPQSDAGGAVDHNALTNNILAQQKIVQELTGALPQVENVSVSAELASLNAALQLIQLGLVDPLNYAKEGFEKLKAVLGDMGAGAQTALQQNLGYLKASVEALVSGASLNLTFANADGAFAMRIDADVDARRVTKIVLGATGTRQFIGNGASTAAADDDVGLVIAQSRLGAVIYSDGTFALTAQGGASAVGLSELSVSGNVGVVAGTASGVNEAIDVTFTDTVTITLPAATAFKVTGNLAVRTPVGTLGGNFSLQKSTAGPDGIAGNADDKAELMIGTTNSSVFLGVGDVTPDPSDDVGIRISGTSAFVLIGTDPGPSRYAFYVVSTNVGLVGFGSDLSFSGTFYSVRNTFTTAVINRTMQVDGMTLTLSVPSGTSSFGVDNGTLQTPIARLKGNFRMALVGNELQIMASSVEVFVGDDKGTPSATDDVGVKLTGGSFIGVISPGSGYAFEAGGTAQVLNIPSLTLNGTLTMQINRLGVAINRTITLLGVSRTLNFASGVSRVGGSATLQTPGGNLTGNFAIQKNAAGEILIGATGVRIFAGDDKGTPADTTDDIGVVVQDASLALVILPDNTYAFDTGGERGVVGCAGSDFGCACFIAAEYDWRAGAPDADSWAGDGVVGFGDGCCAPGGGCGRVDVERAGNRGRVYDRTTDFEHRTQGVARVGK